jgi:hypothetical protein
MASLCTSNVTSGFIDLATFDELEKYMYGGPDATAYFVRKTQKATWFTQVPVILSRASGNPGFGAEWSVSISRAGDYLMSTWLRLTTPEVVSSDNGDAPDEDGALVDSSADRLYVRWTRNLMHNLIRECCITFNDLVAARFDNYHLDFWTAFTVPAGKRTGYNNMIGNFDLLVTPQIRLPQFTLNLPLPFFFTRDSGVALPTAALPYNDMRINFSFRDLRDLLIVDRFTENGSAVEFVQSYCWGSAPSVDNDSSLTAGSLTNVQVWANYAIVSNDERKRMACAPRDILIEQVQTAPRQTFNPCNDKQPRFDIRFSHAIKVLFFGARNETLKCQWSNYTTGTPLPNAPGDSDPMDFDDEWLLDPIVETSLIYENTNRLSLMGSDYFSLINPWYHAPVIPLETGYHMYSYSLDFICLDPMGSTNYGKLTNVSIVPKASDDACSNSKDANDEYNDADLGVAGADPANLYVNQKWEFVVTAVNNNIIRISGGALGFPVL